MKRREFLKSILAVPFLSIEEQLISAITPFEKQQFFASQDDKCDLLFLKGLPHDGNGEVKRTLARKFWKLIESGNFRQIENLPLGSRPLANPQAAHMRMPRFSVRMPPPPTVNSKKTRSELLELYWQALLRDVKFEEYKSDSAAYSAALELNAAARLPGLRKPIASESLFRGPAKGCNTGPYLSQFLLQDIPMGALTIEQKVPVGKSIDFGVRKENWLQIVNGVAFKSTQPFESDRRYMITGRDLGWYVWNDRLFQPYLFAASIILDRDLRDIRGIENLLDRGNPFLRKSVTEGGIYLGPQFLYGCLGKISALALEAMWYQKWRTYKRLRPEELAGYLQLNSYSSCIDRSILASEALTRTQLRHGTSFLPLQYIEGSPMHPSYGSGHAAVAGACVTLLKFFFNEDYELSNLVVPTRKGDKLMPYQGSQNLSLGGELNKLAYNIGMGRNFAGIHFRSDIEEGLKFGESIATNYLRRVFRRLPERVHMSFTSFNGKKIKISTRESV